MPVFKSVLLKWFLTCERTFSKYCTISSKISLQKSLTWLRTGVSVSSVHRIWSEHNIELIVSLGNLMKQIRQIFLPVALRPITALSPYHLHSHKWCFITIITGGTGRPRHKTWLIHKVVLLLHFTQVMSIQIYSNTLQIFSVLKYFKTLSKYIPFLNIFKHSPNIFSS